MGEWILNIALVSFVIYKLGSLTELDFGARLASPEV